MSKVQLRKELAGMEKEQLIEMILEAYSAQKEIKEYFEFFINPDVDKLLDKYEIIIAKELNRTRRGGYSKARVSFIKAQLKEFASFQPGFEAQLKLMIYTLSYAMACEAYYTFSETLMRGFANLVVQIVDLANINLQFDKTVKQLEGLFSHPHAGSRYFRRYLSDTLQGHLSSCKLN